MKSEKTGGDHGRVEADGKIGSCAYMYRHVVLHILYIINYVYHGSVDEGNIRTK